MSIGSVTGCVKKSGEMCLFIEFDKHILDISYSDFRKRITDWNHVSAETHPVKDWWLCDSLMFLEIK
jgi:hypothetical protein